MLPITIFTPTYNRKEKISRVYDSLLKQDKNLFEWLIIDDGSDDGTESIILNLKKKASFKIIYHYQKNGGKHRAHNTAIEMAKGKLFLILDSDDQILPYKIDLIWKVWNKYNDDNKNIAGILAHSIDQNNNFIGRRWPKNTIAKSVIELWVDDEAVYGEKMPIYLTNILKKYRFPSLKDSNELIPEGVVWMQIAKKYKMILLDDVTRIYEINNFDALSKSALIDEIGSWGKTILFSILINFSSKYFIYRPIRFVKVAINASRYRIRSRTSYKEQKKYIDNNFAIFLLIVFIPIAKLFLVYKNFKKTK